MTVTKPELFPGSMGNGASETDKYIFSVTVAAWRWLTLILGLGNVAGGLVISVGPQRFRAAPNYSFFDTISLPEQTWPVLLVVSGLLITLSAIIGSFRLSIFSHTMAFIALMWWGIVAFGFLIDGQSIGGGSVFYIMQLALINLVSVVSRILVRRVTEG